MVKRQLFIKYDIYIRDQAGTLHYIVTCKNNVLNMSSCIKGQSSHKSDNATKYVIVCKDF